MKSKKKFIKAMDLQKDDEGHWYVNGSVKSDIFGDVGGNVSFVEGDVRNVGGDVKENIWGDVKGSVEGDVKGSVWGKIKGDVCGDVWGDVKGSVRGRGEQR